MAKLREGTLGDLTSAVAGSATYVGDLDQGCKAYVAGTFVGTWFLDFSADGGTTWGVIATGTAVTAAPVDVPPCGNIRLRCSAFTSGTISGRFGGRNSNLIG